MNPKGSHPYGSKYPSNHLGTPFLLIKQPPEIINPVCRVLILGSPSKVVLASPAGEF